MRNLLRTLGALVLLSACSSIPEPSPEQLKSADYGEKPSEEEVMTAIRRWMSDPTFGLENPASLDVRNLQLHKTYIRTSEGILFGFLACFEWDARKSRGGYGG